jgi:adenylate cyclase
MADSALKSHAAAILAADVAGYSRLMSLDERATVAALDNARSLFQSQIEAHEGRVIDMTGDSVLAMFETGVAAVAAGMAVQKEMHAGSTETPEIRRMHFRIGVHMGDVIEKMDGTVYGDVVNVAARMQTYAPPGGIAMSKAVADTLADISAADSVDLGELYLHNMARPVRMFCLRVAQSSTLSPGQVPPGDDSRPSIAVLPFRKNMADGEDAYFADGIVDDIIHLLAAFKELFVIARGSTLGLGGDEIDLRRVGRELGVRYLLHGSVQRAGGRLRVLAELSEPETGTIIRAYRHDGKLTELFELQDRIALDVVRTIAPQVQARELMRAKRKHPQNMSAYDLMLQGIDQMFRIDTESAARARGLLQQAMVLDPFYATAFSYAAYWYFFRVGEGWSTDPIADVKEAARLAETAIKLNPDDPQGLAIYGHVQSFLLHDFATATIYLDRAIEAGPNSALAHTMSCATCGYLGLGELAVARGQQGLRLSPVDARRFWHEGVLGQAHYINGDYAEAVAFARMAAGRNAGVAFNLRCLTASLVALERMDEARGAAQQLLRVQPGFRLSSYMPRCPFKGKTLDTWIHRLRLAGLPD